MRFTGIVRWFDFIRGLGVIGHETGDGDCHVDHSSLRGTVCNLLAAGDRVEFEVIHSGTSIAAHDVIRIGTVLVPAALEGSC